MGSDRLSAYHEAGHSTLGYLLGQLPERISIRTQGDSQGHVQYLAVEAESIARAALVGTRDIDRDRVMQNLVATAAGPVAQAKVMGGVRSYPFAWTRFDGMHDHAVATRLMTAAGDLLHTSLDDLANEAADLLEVPRIWAAVDRVARELMRYQELDFRHLQLVVLGAVDDDSHRPVYPHVSDKGGRTVRAGARPLSKEQAWAKIAAKSPRGAARVRAWQRGEAADMPPIERR
jgi:hypothetical protein